MGKIKERRVRTANTEIDNKAVLAEAPAKTKEFPYKKILIAVLAVVAVIACVLLIVNAVVDSKASKLADGAPFENAVATEKVEGVLYENAADIIKVFPSFAEAYYNASMNYNNYAGNAKSDANIYNFVVSITDAVAGEKSANVANVMVLSFNKAANKVTYVTIGRSSLVEIPSVGVGPLHDAYKFGGAPLLARTVQENYGIAINGYADMTLDSFVTAADKLGGITVDSTKLSTKEDIYKYVALSEDQDKAIKNVVTALANGAKDAGVMGLVGVVDAIADSMTANISRDDVGDLVSMGKGVFKAEATIVSVGYDTAKGLDWNAKVYEQYPEIFSLGYFDYATEIPALQTAIYGE